MLNETLLSSSNNSSLKLLLFYLNLGFYHSLFKIPTSFSHSAIQYLSIYLSYIKLQKIQLTAQMNHNLLTGYRLVDNYSCFQIFYSRKQYCNTCLCISYFYASVQVNEKEKCLGKNAQPKSVCILYFNRYQHSVSDHLIKFTGYLNYFFL